MCAAFWHLVVLLLVAIGSVLILFGFLRTSYANDGTAKKLVDWGRTHLPHRKSVAIVAAPAASITVSASGSVSVISGPLTARDDSARIDELFEKLARLERSFNSDVESLRRTADEERIARTKTDQDLEQRMTDLQSELAVSQRKNALDGLRMAVVGALLVSAGDVLGAALPLVGIS